MQLDEFLHHLVPGRGLLPNDERSSWLKLWVDQNLCAVNRSFSLPKAFSHLSVYWKRTFFFVRAFSSDATDAKLGTNCL